jgi:ubiquinone/menaquinone biosynthesis C-methylase UbiE
MAPSGNSLDNRNSIAASAKEKCLEINSRYEDDFSKRNHLIPVYQFFDLKGKKAKILDFGCGTGWTTVLLAQKAEFVCAIDISCKDINLINEIIGNNSIANIFPFVCNAEKLLFKDESFDFVFGNAILHHLNLDPALSEVSRVLNKNGKAAFCEPYGHNPLLNLYRFVKDNYIKKITGIHRPIKCTDKIIFEKYFRKVSFIETSFTSDKIPFSRSLESNILQKLPFTRKFASYVTILLQK